MCDPYADLLGEEFGSLAAGVRRAHSAPLDATGELDVEHGTRWWVQAMVRVLRLPKAGTGEPVKLTLRANDDCLTWNRQIGGRPLVTSQRAKNGRLVERIGIGSISFHLSREVESLLYEQDELRVLGLRAPVSLAPRVEARVEPAESGWRVEVVVTWRGNLVCRYSGAMVAG